jgi:hypothetical protein
MSNDLTVPSVTTSAAAAEAAGQTKGSANVPAAEAKLVAAAPSLVEPNPSLQLDPALGLVVIEFRNNTGTVTDSIPSERQLEAYQRWATTHFGPAPSGMPPIGAPTVAPAQRGHVVITTATTVKEPTISTPRTHAATARH